jgi:hypothetical protein
MLLPGGTDRHQFFDVCPEKRKYSVVVYGKNPAIRCTTMVYNPNPPSAYVKIDFRCHAFSRLICAYLTGCLVLPRFPKFQALS